VYNQGMSKKAVALLVVLIVSPVVLYLLWPTEEARIRKLVREAARAAEAGDVEGVMSKVSFSYQDEHGLSYAVIKRNLGEKFKLFSDIEVEYENLRVEVDEEGKEAEAAMDLRMIATAGDNDRGYVLGDVENPARLKLRLRKGGPLNKWLVVSASGFIEGASSL